MEQLGRARSEKWGEVKYDLEEHDDFHPRFTRHFNEHHADHTSAHHRPPSTEIDALANKIEEEADFLAEHSHAVKAVVDFCRHCDRQIRVGSGNIIDLKMALCAGIVGVMIFEIGATAATPCLGDVVPFWAHFIEMQSEAAKNAYAGSSKDVGRDNPDGRHQGGQTETRLQKKSRIEPL